MRTLRSLRRFHRDGKAQALVEFAFVFPIMIFLVLGTIQLAYIAVAQYIVNYATYAAVRSEIVQDDPGGSSLNVRLVAGLILLPTLGLSLFDVDIKSGDDDIVDVEVTYWYRLVIPGWKGIYEHYGNRMWGLPAVELSSRCAMMKESSGPD